MKRLTTLTLALTSLTLSILPTRAQYTTGDLMIGFENGTSKDVLFDLGPAQAFVTATGPLVIPLANLNAALISAFGSGPGLNVNIFAAVFGNVNPNDPNNTLYASRPHNNAASGSGQSGTSSLMNAIEGQYNNDFAGVMTRAIVQDSGAEPNTYLSQVSGGKAFNFVTESQFSLGSFTIDRIPSTTNGGGPVANLGTLAFAFDGSGNLTSATFNPTVVPEPSTYALALCGAGFFVLLAKRRLGSKARRITA